MKAASRSQLETKKRERLRKDVRETSLVIPPIPDKVTVDFSRTLDLSCKDWATRIVTGQSLMPHGLRLDENRARRARMMFDLLKLPDVTGTPTFGDVGGEWFKEIVGAVFGTWNGVQRAVNEFFLLVPKKSSKTTNSAGIMVTAMMASERPRAEFLLIAPTHQVAELAFNQALGMIEADKTLRKLFHVKEYQKFIKFRPTGTTLKIKSFDPAVLTGVKPAGVLLDELHVIAEHANADRVLGQVRGGLISSPEAFVITITTQSERVPVGIFRTELQKARKVRDGEAKLKLLPIMYEFPPAMVKSGEWRDTANWHMVNPNNGRSMTIARLVEDYDNARTTGEEEVRRWASQHLNIEIGLALHTDHWVGAEFWTARAIPMDLDTLLAKSEVVTLGIDGGGLDDMLALTVCGRDADTKRWTNWSRAWIHEIAMERRKKDAQVYKDFARDGDLVIVNAIGDDVTDLGDVVEQIVQSGKLSKVGIDQSAIGGIIDELVLRGVRGPEDKDNQIVGIPQGWRLTAAIKTVERKLADGTLTHALQPLTRWCAENARVEPRGNAIMITKQASGFAKIDPLMSTFDAVELMSRNPPAAHKLYQMMFVGGG